MKFATALTLVAPDTVVGGAGRTGFAAAAALTSSGETSELEKVKLTRSQGRHTSCRSLQPRNRVSTVKAATK